MKKQTSQKSAEKKQPQVDISTAKDKEEKHGHDHKGGEAGHDWKFRGH